MARGYSLDLRTRVIDDLESGMSADDVAVKYSVAVRTIYAWQQLKRETGSLQPRKGQTGPKLKLKPYREKILAAIQNNPNLTLEELQSQFQLPGCIQTLWNALNRWGIVLKKSHPSHRTESA